MGFAGSIQPVHNSYRNSPHERGVNEIFHIHGIRDRHSVVNNAIATPSTTQSKRQARHECSSTRNVASAIDHAFDMNETCRSLVHASTTDSLTG